MSAIAIPRSVRYARVPLLTEGTCTNRGVIKAVRRKTKKYARHYQVDTAGPNAPWETVFWLRRDEFTVVPCTE